MVNPGHASKGCVNCKTRRIKCDETRPNCRKCVAGGRTCLGYRKMRRRIVKDPQDTSRFGSVKPSSCALGCPRPESHSLDMADPTSDSARAISQSAADTSVSEAASVTVTAGLSGTQQQTPSQCILDTIGICFESLWDPVQTRQTRRLMLQSYRNALHILRVALVSDPNDQSLIAPTRSLAIYEVCCSESRRPFRSN